MKTEAIQEAAFRVFGVTLGTSAATYAASAPIVDRLALVRALLPQGWHVEPITEDELERRRAAEAGACAGTWRRTA
jgi:hypothetical protein